MKVTSQGDFSLESLPDVPDEEWIRSFVADYNDHKRQVVAAVRALTYADNTPYREKSVNLVHGEETTIAVPEGMKTIRSVVAIQVEGLTLASDGKATGAVYELALAALHWRPSTKSGRVVVRADYLAPSGLCSIYRSAALSPASGGSAHLIPLDTSAFSGGDLEYDAANNAILCQSPGYVFASYSLAWTASAVGQRQAMITLNNSIAVELWGRETETPSGTYNTAMAGGGLIAVSAGDLLQLWGQQDSGGALALNTANRRCKLDAHYVAPAIGTTGRVNLLFVGE